MTIFFFLFAFLQFDAFVKKHFLSNILYLLVVKGILKDIFDLLPNTIQPFQCLPAIVAVAVCFPHSHTATLYIKWGEGRGNIIITTFLQQLLNRGDA